MLRRYLHHTGKVKSGIVPHREPYTWLAGGSALLFTMLELMHTFQLVGYVGDPIWPARFQAAIQLLLA